MSEQSYEGLRLCPTKISGDETLFAHKVTHAQCQDRQRGHYHKCFTCVFNNAYAGAQANRGTAPVQEPARARVG